MQHNATQSTLEGHTVYESRLWGSLGGRTKSGGRHFVVKIERTGTNRGEWLPDSFFCSFFFSFRMNPLNESQGDYAIDVMIPECNCDKINAIHEKEHERGR